MAHRRYINKPLFTPLDIENTHLKSVKSTVVLDNRRGLNNYILQMDGRSQKALDLRPAGTNSSVHTFKALFNGQSPKSSTQPFEKDLENPFPNVCWAFSQPIFRTTFRGSNV
jgi:hypothetical protein